MELSTAAASSHLPPAHSPHPRYRLLERIGQGGMGEVWRTHDRLTGQVVALKRVRVPARSSNEVPGPDEVLGPDGVPSLDGVQEKTSLGAAPTLAPDSLDAPRPQVRRGEGSLSPIAVEFAMTMAGPGPLSGARTSRSTGEVSRSATPSSTAESIALRLHLTQEFRTLASLRHPHIVSVLDYGFDRNQQPYFTMEFLDGAMPLDAAARGLPRAAQVGLLLQTLQALTYLHRRGILHRDLKPGNVLIVAGPQGPQVKVLDFGLALLSSGPEFERAQVAGTMGYIAPEIFVGAQASEASDLFAVGVMAHQILAGTHPLGERRTAELLTELLGSSPLFSEDVRLGSALSAVLRRALCRAPAERYFDAAAFGRELACAAGLQPLAETTDIRESFLQAATFVARDKELARLRQALDAAAAGRGSVWLVGGESGVGKSRLLEELRTLAQVRGASVLRGQAVSAGGGAYQVWQGILRPLCLDAVVDDLDASVLRGVVPDIAALLDRSVVEAPVIDPQPAQARFLAAVERLLSTQQALKVLLLEDLQWAEPASLAVLQRLTSIAARHSMLVVGSYRRDERPTLAAEVPGAQSLPLHRLSAKELALLSTSMLGEAGRRPELVKMLERETEGNAYFVVEVLRALAEEAGQLSDVGRLRISGQVITGGIQSVIQRRLGRVPEGARPLLRCAAMAGRMLDLEVLRSMFPELDLWLGPCANVAVLEVDDQAWRFAHDKLREALLSDIAADEQKELHGQIARAIESIYPDAGPHAAKLVFHHRGAGSEERAAHYGALAGERAIQQGALTEAIALLQPALSIQKASQASPRATMRTRRFLSDALFGLGRVREAIVLLEEAIDSIGIPIPDFAPAFALAMLAQVAEQLLRRLGGAAIFARPESEQSKLIAEFIPMLRNSEAYLYLGQLERATYILLLGINLAEAVDDLSQQVVGHISLSYMWSTIPIPRLQGVHERLAIAAAASCSDVRSKTDLLRIQALMRCSDGHFAAAQYLSDKVVAGGIGIGDVNLQAFGMIVGQGVAIYQGDYARASKIFAQSRELVSRGINIDYAANLLVSQAVVDLRRGELELAELESAEAFGLGTHNSVTTPRIRSMQALCALRLHDVHRARELADEAWAGIRKTPSIASVVDAHAQILEVYLHVAEVLPSAQIRQRIAQLLRRLGFLVRASRIGQPVLDLNRGRSAWQCGRPVAALRHFQQSLQAAVRLAMPHEEAQAHSWLGRLLRSHSRPASAPGDSAAHFGAALRIFDRLGATWDRDEVRRMQH